MAYQRDPDRAVRELTTIILEFLAREDLTRAQRDWLTGRLLESHADPLMGDAAGRLCVTSRGLVEVLGLGKGGAVTLSQWRNRHVGPPHVRYKVGAKVKILYPVEGVRRWMDEMACRYGLRLDPEVCRAFGMRRVAHAKREAEAA